MQPQSEISAGRPDRWIPGEPWRPLPHHIADAMRSYAEPTNIAARHACERREAQAEADGLACPRCDAPIGQPCFGPDARSNHPMRAMAHWAARVRANTCNLCRGIGYSEGYPCTCAVGRAAA